MEEGTSLVLQGAPGMARWEDFGGVFCLAREFGPFVQSLLVTLVLISPSPLFLFNLIPSGIIL